MNATRVVDTYNVAVGGAITVLTAIFGPQWYVFAAFLLLNVFDYITGWYKARKSKTESSSIGLAGIVKKVMYWIIIAVAFLMSYVFVLLGRDVLHVDLNFLTQIGWFTTACLLINEIRSILENLVECGVNVPDVLIKGLAVTEKLINKENESEDVK